jgi:hypothetical protein
MGMRNMGWYQTGLRRWGLDCWPFADLVSRITDMKALIAFGIVIDVAGFWD